MPSFRRVFRMLYSESFFMPSESPISETVASPFVVRYRYTSFARGDCSSGGRGPAPRWVRSLSLTSCSIH